MSQPTIIIEMAGVPVPQPRVKASSFGGRAKVYTPTTVKNTATGQTKAHPIVQFKSDLKEAAVKAYDGPLLEVPVAIELEFLFPRTNGLMWKTKPMPRLPHTARGDVDNLAKSVMDVLTGIVWRDDKQVYQASIVKWICAGDEKPGTVVKITAVDA